LSPGVSRTPVVLRDHFKNGCSKNSLDGQKITVPAEVSVRSPFLVSGFLTRARVSGGEVEISYLARAAVATHHRGQTGATLLNLDMLDWALADLDIDAGEQHGLQVPASDFGLSAPEVAGAHQWYLNEMIAAAARDQRVTDADKRGAGSGMDGGSRTPAPCSAGY
jgi:hypothetical protein